MAIGFHLARCENCGKQWMVGDCIPAFCSPECERKWQEWWADLQAKNKAEDDKAASAAGGGE